MNKHLMLARQLAQDGSFSEAVEACKKLIKRGTDVPLAKKLMADCLYNIGMMHFAGSGLLAEAEKHFREAIAAQPDHVDALFNLGALLSGRAQYGEAISAFQKGLSLRGDNITVLEYLAKAQVLDGRLDEASGTLLKLAELVPSDEGVFLLREAFLVPKVAPDKQAILKIRAKIDEKLAAIESRAPSIRSPLRMPTPYFPLSYHGIGNREIVERLARIYLKLVPSLEWAAPHTKSRQGPNGRIRIGFASHFFYEHSIGNTSRGLVERLNRDRFEVVLIRLGKSKRDALADHFDKTADKVIVVGDSDLQSAREAIADLKLDILFYQDIGMEPLSYFLAFARLAPVQLTSFGHPDTTGIPNLDYFISSENYELPNAAEHYSEKLVTLPHAGTLAYYHRPAEPAVSIDLAEFGIEPADNIYLCPQALFKLHPDMDEIFLGILARDAVAKIILIELDQAHIRIDLERRMSAALGEMRKRVVFIKSQPYQSYLALLRSADVILDSVHFNGQNTNLEALSMNIPVVTLPAGFQRGRHTYGMYLAMGFMDLVAATRDDYVSIAVRVANDADFRRRCQERISASSGVLYNNPDIVRAFENAFIGLLQERDPKAG